MRIYAAALLIILSCAANAATLNTGTPTANTSTYDIGTDEYEKVYLRFSLPALPSGATITSATLYLKCSALSGSGAVSLIFDDTIGAHVETGADTAWTNASPFATVDAITYGAELDTNVVTAAVYYSWDVTGSATEGITKEYADSQTTTNVVLYLDSSGGEDTKDGTTLRLGVNSGDSADFDNSTQSDNPYIEISYTGGSVLPMSPVPGGVQQVNKRNFHNEKVSFTDRIVRGGLDRWGVRGIRAWAEQEQVVSFRGHDAAVRPRTRCTMPVVVAR